MKLTWFLLFEETTFWFDREAADNEELDEKQLTQQVLKALHKRKEPEPLDDEDEDEMGDFIGISFSSPLMICQQMTKTKKKTRKTKRKHPKRFEKTLTL